MRYQVIIVGAGLAGLTAGLHAAERGASVLILEATPAPDPEHGGLGGRLQGGPATIIEKDGKRWVFPSEHGLHGIWGQYHNVRALMKHAQIDFPLIPARREAWIFRQHSGKIQWAEGGSALRTSWIPAPFHYLALFSRPRFLQMLTLRDLASMFRLLGSLFLAIAYDPAVEGLQLKDRTLADFFKGWSPTLQALFVGLARNFTSARPEEVPQSGFIAFLRFYTLLRRDSWRFSYFDRDSWSALIGPMVKRVTEAGAEIRTGAKVTRLEREDSGWRAIWDGGEASADQVILALDAPANRELLTTSPATMDAAHDRSWPLAIPTVILRYWFSAAPRAGGLARAEAGIFTGDFVLDNFFWLHKLHGPFIDWHRATGGSAIECHIYGPASLIAEPDAVLLAKGLLDLQKVWPSLRGAVIQQTIRRNPASHSLFSVGANNAYLGVETPWDGLWACGDWVAFPHPSLYMERAVVTGIAAANGALDALKLQTWPILPAQKPEILARGMEKFLHWVRRRASAHNRQRNSLKR